MNYKSNRIYFLVVCFILTACSPIYANTQDSPQIIFNTVTNWGTSYLGEITITNTSDTILENWELQFSSPNKITSIWNASISSKVSDLYTLESEDYNYKIYPNESIQIGFIADYKNSISLPEFYNFSTNHLKTSHNTITTPCALQLNIPYTTNFNTNQDELWFSFKPDISGSYEILSTGLADINITILDESQKCIIASNNNTINPNKLATTLLSTHNYQIKTTPINLSDTTSTFNILIKHINEPNDTYFNEQWALLNKQTGIDINILPAWDYLNKKPIQIGMCDTGVYYEHEDLQGIINLDSSYNFTHHMNNIFPENERYKDSLTAIYGHGTHVAGTLGANSNNSMGISGLSPSCLELVSLKTLGRKLDTSTTYTNSIDAFIEAVAYAKEHDIKIINCSFGGISPSQAEKEVMSNTKDILFVIAAGNNGKNLDKYPVYPACYYLPNSIVVANIDSTGTLHPTSNYAGPTDIAAPGTKIISTIPYNKYKYMSGTSMAAPFVSGVCSLLWAQNEDLTPQQVKAYITNPSNVTSLNTLDGKVASGGILNAYKAIVCPSLNTDSIESTARRTTFEDDKKLQISYYKEMAPLDSKTDEVIVSLTNEISIDELINRLTHTNNFNKVLLKNYLEIIDVYILKFSSIEEADTAVDLLNNYDDVSYAEPNYVRLY